VNLFDWILEGENYGWMYGDDDEEYFCDTKVLEYTRPSV
jgi:hypothetical protein